jgi:hypothetical protein
MHAGIASTTAESPVADESTVCASAAGTTAPGTVPSKEHQFVLTLDPNMLVPLSTLETQLDTDLRNTVTEVLDAQLAVADKTTGGQVQWPLTYWRDIVCQVKEKMPRVSKKKCRVACTWYRRTRQLPVVTEWSGVLSKANKRKRGDDELDDESLVGARNRLEHRRSKLLQQTRTI